MLNINCIICICSPRQSALILLWLPLLNYHWIPQTTLKNPQLWHTAPKTSHQRCDTVRGEQVEVFVFTTKQKKQKSAVPWPAPHGTHCQVICHSFLLDSTGRGMYGSSVIPSFPSLLSALLQSPACTGSGSLLMQIPQLRISPVVCWSQAAAPRCSPGTEQFRAALFPNRASANFIRVMDYVKKPRFLHWFIVSKDLLSLPFSVVLP